MTQTRFGISKLDSQYRITFFNSSLLRRTTKRYTVFQYGLLSIIIYDYLLDIHNQYYK